MVLALYVAAQAADFERWSRTLRLTQYLAQPTPVVQSLDHFVQRIKYTSNKTLSDMSIQPAHF